MAKKDFSSINTGSVYGSIEKATSERGQQGTVSPEEKELRQSELRTQGRKGCKAVRINMAFSDPNYDFIRVMARISGKTMTEFVNDILTSYREDHTDVYDQAKSIIDNL